MNFSYNLYQKFIERELPLGDQLAAARSILANERTFLSYQRTAITLFITGATFIRFFESNLLAAIGWAFMPAAVITMILGTYRYFRMRALIRNLEHDTFIVNGNENQHD